MDEYIKRESLIAWLHNMAVSPALIAAIKNKERFPAADVVEVVRCSECKHHHDPMRCSLWYGTLDDNEYFLEHGKDFYCAFGERRSENES